MKSKILLIDDDKNIRSLLSTLLELEGFQMVQNVGLSADAILEVIQAEMPDLILMDVHMKTINGIDILRMIRGDAGLDRIRIIMSSGLDLREKCLSAGANDFLMKPYMPADLLSLIK